MDVPELTAEEIQARVLHRDGLMLVIDKPAGLPVHRGPKGGAPIWNLLRRAAVWGCRARRFSPIGSIRTLPVASSSGRHRQGGPRRLGLLFKHGKISKNLTGAVVEGGPVEDQGTIDMPLGRLKRRARLVAEARCGWPAGHHQLESARTRRMGLAWLAARTGHRPHPSIAGSLRRDGLADCRRQHLWKRSPLRRTETALIPARSGFRFRRTRTRYTWSAPAPAHLHERLRACGLERGVMVQAGR